MNKPRLTLLLVGLLLFAQTLYSQTNTNSEKPRIIITADPELDDNNSLIRLIMYSSDLNIEGLIYASSQFHWKGDGKGTKWFVPGREYDRFGMGDCPCESWRWAEDERFIHDIVEAYEAVYPNLKVHNSEYPEPSYLKSKIRYGNIEFDGDFSEDSPGSELIREAILDNKPGPLFITAWGGASTIARALKVIQDQYEFTTDWPAIQDKISRKVILLLSGDQDDTYATYILPNWPKIDARRFRQGPHYAYGAQINASSENAPFLTPDWMKTNINDRGPLGELYRVWGDGKQMVEGDKVDYFGFSGLSNDELKQMGYFVWLPVQAKGSWLGEGDNHTFMNMLGNGLRAYEKGYYGGWGGREIKTQEKETITAMATQGTAEDMAAQFSSRDQSNESLPEYPNFFPAAQRDFAERLKWSVTPNFKDANHIPVLEIEGPLTLVATPGQTLKIQSNATDPDGDQTQIKWMQMPTTSFDGEVEFLKAEGNMAEIKIPETAIAGQSVHIIAVASDKTPAPLTAYKRVIIIIKTP